MAGYLTVAAVGEAKIVIKMSRFLAFALPVQSAAEARGIIAQYSNRYHDARHVCWAYVVGASVPESMASDNGEPSGTAGRPILGQIKSLELTNTLVIVVRYFGGIKLGTPGLIAAYRDAARAALESAGSVERCEMIEVALTFPYPVVDRVMKLVKRPEFKVLEQQFDNTCTLRLLIPTDLTSELAGRVEGIATFTSCSAEPQ